MNLIDHSRPELRRPEFRRRSACEPSLPPAMAWRSEGFAEDLEPAVAQSPLRNRVSEGWRLTLAGIGAALTLSPPAPRG